MKPDQINDLNRTILNKVDRTGPGEEGLYIPEFISSGRVISNNLYPINNWGNNSTQKQRWLNWVEENRPIPLK